MYGSTNVDIDGYIMYFDEAHHMWPEIEGGEDFVEDEVTSVRAKTSLNSDALGNCKKATKSLGDKREITSIVKHIKDGTDKVLFMKNKII